MFKITVPNAHEVLKFKFSRSENMEVVHDGDYTIEVTGIGSALLSLCIAMKTLCDKHDDKRFERDVKAEYELVKGTTLVRKPIEKESDKKAA